MNSRPQYMPISDLFEKLSASQGTFFAVIDVKVKPHLPDWIKSLETVFWIQSPEEEKNLQHYQEITSFLLEKGITRTATLVVMGGGATTDLGGFVAATLLRGLSWIAIPTTLLGMVDASIGGKVGVNTIQGKNLLGAFHAPAEIVICDDFLLTLSESEVISGKGEILKYGFLSSAIYTAIKNGTNLHSLAIACADFKHDVVTRDFKEEGERIFLNLGHTLGHAFEFQLGIPHGLAVAMGMKYLFEVFQLNHLLKDWMMMVEQLSLPKEKLDLDFYPQFNKELFKLYLGQDKKKTQDSIRLVLVSTPGKCLIQNMRMVEFFQLLEAHEKFQR